MMEVEKNLSEDDLLLYGAYMQVALTLQHSNLIQLLYKTLAMTWLLATLLGSGYSLSSAEVNLPFHPLLVVSLLCSASLLVILLIGYLDVIVQEKRIASAVNAGLELERQHSKIPRAYHHVMDIHPLFGYVFMKSVFYGGCLLILILTICASFSAYLFIIESEWILVPLLTALVIPLLVVLMYILTKKTNPYPVLDVFNSNYSDHSS